MQNPSNPARTRKNPLAAAVKITLKRTSKKAPPGAVDDTFPAETAQLKQLYGLEADRLYTGRQVCEKLQISVDCFRQLCRSGHLRYHAVAGRLWRVPGCEIIKYLQNCLK